MGSSSSIGECQGSQEVLLHEYRPGISGLEEQQLPHQMGTVLQIRGKRKKDVEEQLNAERSRHRPKTQLPSHLRSSTPASASPAVSAARSPGHSNRSQGSAQSATKAALTQLIARFIQTEQRGNLTQPSNSIMQRAPQALGRCFRQPVDKHSLNNNSII